MGKVATDRFHCPECGTDLTVERPVYAETIVRTVKVDVFPAAVRADGADLEHSDGEDKFLDLTCSHCGAHLEDLLDVHGEEDITWDA